MRLLLLLISFYFSTVTYGQGCSCKDAPELKDVISCKKVLFSNGAKLYRQFNCDSSWLTFESKNGRKTVLYSLEAPLINLSERLGYQFIKENKQSFLIINRLISGCCTLPEFLLYNKNNGKLLENLGSLIYYSEDAKENFVLYFSDSTLNAVTLHYLNSGKKYQIPVPQNRFAETLEKTGENYAELLFDEGELKKSVLAIGYRYQRKGEGEQWYDDTIRLDLKKYVR
ncbi:hypothetical protein HRG84_24350 [Flavisolibacter sp. BT320]|nr:hypothetical protein [Flavisolibacter longurius]